MISEVEDFDNILGFIDRFLSEEDNRRIFISFGRVFQYNDDPKFFQYSARLFNPGGKNKKPVSAGGFSLFSRESALIKCFVESLERYCLYSYDDSMVVRLSYNGLEESGKHVLDPTTIVSFSDRQKETWPLMRVLREDEFGWVEGVDLISGRKILIPSQIVYLSYSKGNREKTILLPISTGAAGGLDYDSCVYRGILECIERDAFIINYLNKLKRRVVDLKHSNNKEMLKVINYVGRYNLDLYVVDISLDFGLYTFEAVLVDKTGIGTPVAVGLKSGLDPVATILGAIQEALHPRSWIRQQKERAEVGDIKPSEIDNIVKRGIYWFKTENIKRVMELMDVSLRQNTLEEYKNLLSGNARKDLEFVLKMLKKSNIRVYCVDVTTSAIRNAGFAAVKVIMPDLQPLYLNESYPYLGGSRLYSVPGELGLRKRNLSEGQLNSFPHPFL